MRIKFQQFLNGNHSWGVCGQNLAKSFIKKGHDVTLQSTNGYDFFPKELQSHVRSLSGSYDMAISYTAPGNFSSYLAGAKHKFGIWCYEWPLLPNGFAKHYLATDKILAPSSFARDIFINNKVPSNKVTVVPHGINREDYLNAKPFSLKTNKSKKILVNIGQPHLRKNIVGMLEAFGKAFTKNDDVCLVAKISKKEMKFAWDQDPNVLFKDFYKKFPNHAEVELITNHIPDIASLYLSCDILYTLSFAEGYYMPGLEAFAANKMVIAPRYGGQLDYLNDSNSLLVDGKVVRADMKMQYWSPNLFNTCFESSTDDAASKLQTSVKQYDELMNKFSTNIQSVVDRHSWDQATDKILELCNEQV